MGMIFRNEWKLLVRDRTALGLLLLAALMFGWAAANGARFAEQRQMEVERLVAQAGEEAAADLAKIQAGEVGGAPWDDAANPYRRKAVAALPASPTAAMAVGMSDLQGYWAEVSIYTLPSRPLRNYELGNPFNRLNGSFDLAFVLVFLFPLLLLALTFDLISGDREKGILMLMLAQGANLRLLVLGKLGARAVFGVGAALGTSVAALLLLTGSARPPLWGLFLWSVTLIVYAAFWLALAWLVATRGKSSSTNALTLGGVWLLLVIVAPMGLHVVASRLHELPSRHTLIVQEREAETAGLREQAKLLEKFALDHPELMPAGQPVDWTNFATSYYASRVDLESRLAPIFQELETDLRSQQELVGRYRFLSPAVVAHEGLLELAGSNSRRHQAYLEQVRSFYESWCALLVPKTFSGGRMSSAEFDLLPKFAFAEEPIATLIQRLAASWLGMLIPALALFWFGWRRLKVLPEVSEIRSEG